MAAKCMSGRRQIAFVLSPDKEFINTLRTLWSDDVMHFTVFERGRAAIEHLFNSPPDLLIVDDRLEDMSAAEVASLVKSENVYRQLPVIMCLDANYSEQDIDWSEVEVDDFLVRPLLPHIIKDRVELTLCRAMRALDANPLSKLPGNTSIIQRIQELIDRGEDFGLAYCDLDYFKSFNDKYGFSRGDEVLMMTARIIVNTVKAFGGPGSFVGHVGGDDFVFIVTEDIVEEACKRVIASFDAIVPSFYDTDDRERGSIVSTDRNGSIQTFPIMAVSIAVVLNTGGRLNHFGEVSAIAMSLKKKAKASVTSSYVIDQRDYVSPAPDNE
ncbi:MAG: diguanylate cyclase domain-containing protein [Desulfovibrio sp.]